MNARAEMARERGMSSSATSDAACSAGLHLTIPQLVDDLDNTVMRAFDAFPDRLYIISPDGRIAFQGGRGPRGFSVPEMEMALKKLLAAKSTPAKD